MQKSVRYNEGHALYLAVLARKESTRRGYLSKKTAETSRWHDKWFALYQNMLFYFEGEQSTRPAGMYMLEGCSCERALAPKGASAVSVKDSALDKQVAAPPSLGLSLPQRSSPSPLLRRLPYRYGTLAQKGLKFNMGRLGTKSSRDRGGSSLLKFLA